MLVAVGGRRGGARATWFLTTAASMSTFMYPPAARAFSAVHGAAFSPTLAPASKWQQRPSFCEKGAALGRPAVGAWGQLSGRSCLRHLSAPHAEATDANPAPPAEEEVDPGVVEGTDLRVLKYPHPSLRANDEEVTVFDDALKKTLKEMFLVMYASKGVGLAAPQVGINKRIMVFNPDGDKKKWLSEVSLINPKIVDQSEATDIELEACLSFPGMEGKVRRHKWIKVEAQNAAGKKITKKYTGWTARVFQHEYDHLEGTVYVDRLEEESDKVAVKPKLEELAKAYKDEHGDDGAPELKF